MKSNFKFEKNNHWPGKFDGNDDCKNILQWNTITDDTERRAIKTVNFPLKTTPSRKENLFWRVWNDKNVVLVTWHTDTVVLEI